MKKLQVICAALLTLAVLGSCGKAGTAGLASDAADRVFVKPGDKDKFYLFASGGFSGQLGVNGLPSGRLLRVIPVFSQWPETGYGYDDSTKAMLNTSHGFVPWDDSHHPQASVTDGKQDGRWIFINGNNTPRIARIDLKSFETEEIIEIPNSAGNHPSAFITENSEYVIAGTRFSVPIPQAPMSWDQFQKEMKASMTFVKVDKESGKMSIDFQILLPGISYDLGRCGKGPSKDWCFVSSYNTEQAYKMLEVQASKKDKDFVMAINWKMAQACVAQGKARQFPGSYAHNHREPNQDAVSTVMNGVKMLDPKDCPGMVFYMPTPKSPHGADVDPSGEYIVAGGKLATVIPVHSFSKMLKAIEQKEFSGDFFGIPVIKYESSLAGEVKKPCLGPLHTEFDGKGYAYTSCFVSSEAVKWKLGTWEVVQHLPAYYSIGHLTSDAGDTKEPGGKYLVLLNKITKDRYLQTGMELVQSAQLYDISGSNAELLLDFPTHGEPHYAQIIPADMLKKQDRIFRLEDNRHPRATKKESEARVVNEGGAVHVYMTMIRSHFKPDVVEVQRGQTVYFHITNLEQDFDVPHGFAVMGSNAPNVLVMPGQTRTIRYDAKEAGIYPFYCTDFCSALHQEMQQYIRVQ
jgi:nitrous-oxide reductase